MALEPLRKLIAGTILKITGSGQIRFDAPPGDPGLFGPDAVCWRVHADFVPMVVGGVSALLLQMLHPLAIAGVWDHSNFRDDVMGRLARTAQFIAGTTYAARAEAETLIARVRRIHERVQGKDASGQPYSASDPDLLTWVHVAEVSGFLAAHLRFTEPDMPIAEQDRYYAEMALVARMLGARDVPETAAAVQDYLAGMVPQLRFDDRVAEVLRVISTAPVRPAALGVFRKMVTVSAFQILPDPIRALYPRKAQPRFPVASGLMGMATPAGRWAMQGGVARRARARVAAGNPAPSPMV
ncbi:oxygenase MpaB family protein [Pseudogemmobacter bohemicus]|uniref:oxygenase MpaB family protein n=1 Tax=Pseudogemmobacter bohemicus TaxID=2250708 RepID=UPI0018E56365|nr:oxygenase MpaB family protein [Pseudogemmobacter bohemicus]